MPTGRNRPRGDALNAGVGIDVADDDRARGDDGTRSDGACVDHGGAHTDYHVLPDRRVAADVSAGVERREGADVHVVADERAARDDRVGADHAAHPDDCARADRGARIEPHVSSDRGMRMDERARGPAGCGESLPTRAPFAPESQHDSPSGRPGVRRDHVEPVPARPDTRVVEQLHEADHAVPGRVRPIGDLCSEAAGAGDEEVELGDGVRLGYHEAIRSRPARSRQFPTGVARSMRRRPLWLEPFVEGLPLFAGEAGVDGGELCS